MRGNILKRMSVFFSAAETIRKAIENQVTIR
eukprot:COSAG06_NODE_3179_length_5724_cov_88.554489_9_plen_31_part_00